MPDATTTDDTRLLADLISRALSIADAMGASAVGISLNEALVQLTGEGVPPRG